MTSKTEMSIQESDEKTLCIWVWIQVKRLQRDSSAVVTLIAFFNRCYWTSSSLQVNAADINDTVSAVSHQKIIKVLPQSETRNSRVFFPGGGLGGSPHPEKILPIPPHPTLVPVFGPRLVPPPAEVRPRKFEKFKYIFVSNLTTFKLKSTLKSCISCLK